MKRIAFELEVGDDEVIDASMVAYALGQQGYTTRGVRTLVEPSQNTYHPERRWLVPS